MDGHSLREPGSRYQTAGLTARLVLTGPLCALVLALVACSSAPSGMSLAATQAPPAVVHVEADGNGDVATLTEALAMVAPGGIITLSAGSHRCAAGPMESAKEVALVGAGADTTEVVCDAPGYVLRHSGSPAFSADGVAFRHEGAEAADALRVEGSGSVSLHACGFSGAVADAGLGVPGAGLVLAGDVSAEVSDSSASHNQIGILVSDRAWAVLTANSTDHNADSGIAYSDSSAGTARENECSFNGEGGIGVTGSAAPTLDANVCSNNLYFGIGYFDSTGGTALGNRCVGNTYMGIIVAGQADPRLETNSCRYNGSFGIFYYYGQPAGVALANDCSGNGQGGIAVGDRAQPVLEANECRNNLGTGIVYYERAGGSATENLLTGNRRYGLAVTQEARPTIGENDIFGNAIEDIRTYHGEWDWAPLRPTPVAPEAS